MLTIKKASIGAAAIGPAIGALPYWVYFAFQVAAQNSRPGATSALRGVAAAAFYFPIVLFAAYVAAAIPAALSGAGYALLLQKQPSLVGSKSLRVICAGAISFFVCALWALTAGQSSAIEFVGSATWPLATCGAFAGAVLAFLFPRSDSRNAAA